MSDPIKDKYQNILDDLSGYIEETEKLQEDEKRREEKRERYRDYLRRDNRYEYVPMGSNAPAADENPNADEGQPGTTAKENGKQPKPEETQSQNKESDESEERTSGGDESSENNEDAKKEASDKDVPGCESLTVVPKAPTEPYHPKVHYRVPDDAEPYLPIETVKKAKEAIKELIEIKKDDSPYIVVSVNFAGLRSIHRFKNLDSAQNYMRAQMEAYFNKMDPSDIGKEIIVDDGKVPKDKAIYKPTPANELDENGHFRKPSEISGKSVRLIDEKRGIIHFIETNKTARWDIYNLNDASAGDEQIDLSFLNFDPDAKDEKAVAEEKANDSKEKKSKFSLFHGRKGKANEKK